MLMLLWMFMLRENQSRRFGLDEAMHCEHHAEVSGAGHEQPRYHQEVTRGSIELGHETSATMDDKLTSTP